MLPFPKNKKKTWTLAGPKKDSPLKPAKLLGPVQIRVAQVHNLK